MWVKSNQRNVCGEWSGYGREWRETCRQWHTLTPVPLGSGDHLNRRKRGSLPADPCRMQDDQRLQISHASYPCSVIRCWQLCWSWRKAFVNRKLCPFKQNWVLPVDEAAKDAERIVIIPWDGKSPKIEDKIIKARLLLIFTPIRRRFTTKHWIVAIIYRITNVFHRHTRNSPVHLLAQPFVGLLLLHCFM